MIGIDHQVEYLIISVLVHMITHWIGPMTSHDVRLLGSYDLTELLYFMLCQSWENTKFMLKIVVTLTYKWDVKVVIYSLWIESMLIEVDNHTHS